MKSLTSPPMPGLEDRLVALARAGATITYGALARELGLRLAELTTALERMMEEDVAQGRPIRAALCEGRLSHGLPARGFFEKAEALGLDITDPADFIARTRQQLTKA